MIMVNAFIREKSGNCRDYISRDAEEIENTPQNIAEYASDSLAFLDKTPENGSEIVVDRIDADADGYGSREEIYSTET